VLAEVSAPEDRGTLIWRLTATTWIKAGLIKGDGILLHGNHDAGGFETVVVLHVETDRRVMMSATTAHASARARSYTETCAALDEVNGLRSHPPKRSRRRMPAKRAIRSSSDG